MPVAGNSSLNLKLASERLAGGLARVAIIAVAPRLGVTAWRDLADGPLPPRPGTRWQDIGSQKKSTT
jgi:hypothetical protein